MRTWWQMDISNLLLNDVMMVCLLFVQFIAIEMPRQYDFVRWCLYNTTNCYCYCYCLIVVNDLEIFLQLVWLGLLCIQFSTTLLSSENNPIGLAWPFGTPAGGSFISVSLLLLFSIWISRKYVFTRRTNQIHSSKKLSVLAHFFCPALSRAKNSSILLNFLVDCSEAETIRWARDPRFLTW